jgi:protein subunit release factor A
MVKDHRSNKVIHQVDRVMDGEIDELIRAYLLSTS